MDNNIIVNSIKKLCKDKNITVSQLEKKIGLSQGLVSKWINTTPSLDKIVDIADYFHVSLDEVVGYKQDDIFLNILHDLTNNRKIKWAIIDMNTKGKVVNPHKIFPFGRYDEEKYTEKSYFTKYKEGFIIIYAFYEHGKLINPDELALYIQPLGSQLEYACQDYTTKDLKSLWFDILSHMDKVPVEIKAEEFKNNFISDQSKFPITSYNDEELKQITKNMIEMEPLLPKLFEAVNNPDFIKLLDIIGYPNLQHNIELAQKLSPYYTKIAHELESAIEKTP